jgi:rod shape-determining protein MreC
VKPRGGSSVLRLALPIKVLIQRFAFLFLILAAFALMLLSKAETSAIEKVSNVVVDIFAPLMDGLSQPAAAISDAVSAVRQLANIHAENDRLRRENARLLAWQETSRRLMAQNQALMSLLEYKPDPRAKYIAARVIGDSGGAFVRSMLINSGRRDGLTKGQAAMTGHGLAGRVTSAGLRSARILLITDINSRVPVIVQASRDRAILAGDNSQLPRLVFLPSNASVNSGDIVVTSGHGGIFPAGLPIGRIIRSDDGVVRVNPFVRFEKLEFVRVIDYASVLPETSGQGGPHEVALE